MTPCYSCSHPTPHKALGPRDNNGFPHSDRCEECPCINDPTFDPATGIRHSLDGHAFESAKWSNDYCGFIEWTDTGRTLSAEKRCSMPRREHLR